MISGQDEKQETAQPQLIPRSKPALIKYGQGYEVAKLVKRAFESVAFRQKTRETIQCIRHTNGEGVNREVLSQFAQKIEPAPIDYGAFYKANLDISKEGNKTLNQLATQSECLAIPVCQSYLGYGAINASRVLNTFERNPRVLPCLRHFQDAGVFNALNDDPAKKLLMLFEFCLLNEVNGNVLAQQTFSYKSIQCLLSLEPLEKGVLQPHNTSLVSSICHENYSLANQAQTVESRVITDNLASNTNWFAMKQSTASGVLQGVVDGLVDINTYPEDARNALKEVGVMTIQLLSGDSVEATLACIAIRQLSQYIINNLAQTDSYWPQAISTTISFIGTASTSDSWWQAGVNLVSNTCVNWFGHEVASRCVKGVYDLLGGDSNSYEIQKDPSPAPNC